MRVSIDKKELSNAVQGVLRAASTSGNIPALQGVLIEASHHLTLTCFNLEMAITTTSHANIEQSGKIVVNAKLFSEMVKKLPNGDSFFTVEKNVITLSGGNVNYELQGSDASEFPELPKVNAEKAFTIDSSDLERLIGYTSYAVGINSNKAAMNGILLAIKPNSLEVVASDGFRLALANFNIQTEREISVIVPPKVLQDAVKLISGEISIDASIRHITLTGNGYTIMSRLIDDAFIDYSSFIPKTHTLTAKVKVHELANAIERCAVIITERLKNPLRLTFKDGININCQTPLGKVVDVVEAVTDGETIEIGFNHRYLADALKSLNTEDVELLMTTNVAPVVVRKSNDDSVTALVLPVRFK